MRAEDTQVDSLRHPDLLRGMLRIRGMDLRPYWAISDFHDWRKSLG